LWNRERRSHISAAPTGERCRGVRARFGNFGAAHGRNRGRDLVLYWQKPLRFRISPKSGPMRGMDSLLDANQALLHDLPKGFLRRPQWLAAGNLLVKAAESGDDADIEEATDLLLKAIDSEGWMSREPRLPR
jgi:hypothetical protein